MLGTERVPAVPEHEDDTKSARKLLIAGTIILFAVRLGVSLVRSGPVVVADEIGYLTNARLLAGGVAGQLDLAPFYHGGYSLLVAPILAATSDPGPAYHLVLALNAALAASVFPLLYLLLTRCFGVPSRVAVGPAFAGALYPSVTVLSQVAMSENALFPLTCVWLFALCRLPAGRNEVGWAVGAGAAGAALYAVHGRMITAVVLTAGVVVWFGIRRRLAPAATVAALVTLGAGLLAIHFLNSYLVTHNYGGHVANEASVRLSALDHPRAVANAVENLVGQTWALLVMTFGLAAVVAADLVRALRDRRAGRGIGPPPMELILVALTVLLLVVSAASFTTRSRADMLIYARYAEVAAPPLVAVGLAILARGRWLPRLIPALAALGVLTVAVVAIRAGTGSLDNANRWNVAALPFVTSDLGVKVLVGAALVAAAGVGLLYVVRTRSASAVWIVGALLFLPTIGYGLRHPVFEAEDAVYPAGWNSPQHAAGAARRLAYDLDLCGHHGFPTVASRYVIQWFLPDTRVLLFHSARQPPPARYVLSDSAWARQRAAGDARRVWTGPPAGCGRMHVMWRISAA